MRPAAGADARAPTYEALLHAAEDLQTQLDEQGILQVIATQLAGVVPYDNGLSVYLLSPNGSQLTPVYADGPHAAEVLAEAPTPIEQGISGAVARTGQARIANDAMGDADVRVVEGTDHESVDETMNLLAVPLRSRKQVLGVLLLYRSLEWPFVPEDLSLAQLFANQAAIAIENARLFKALEELDRLRADFVSTVSHELRTPLTGIIGFTESLQAYWERMSDRKKLEMLDKIRIASVRLERLVRDLLVISRVESGNLPLRLGPVDIAEPIATAVQEIGGKYRGEQVVVEAPAEPVHVMADYDRLCQVVVNLLDNAIKYSPEHAPVTIRWHTHGDTAILAVTDRGCGIAPEDVPRLFTRFGKIGTTIRAGHIGTGLGLYISRGLVEAMHGHISVESAPGQGSTFRVVLPVAGSQ